MIYVFANDDRGLTVYASRDEAISACEAVDVEADNYRFFDPAGQPLRPRIIRPTSRTLLGIGSGQYVLEQDSTPAAQPLALLLPQVSYVEGCGINSTAEVVAELERCGTAAAHAPSNKSLERTRER